ncbi:MAG TPA: type II toxin-antitoxin system HicB family antitoxin [Methanosarcinaceae archaeon]|nr:type II toxin-antitoxin system HicB family antitoxin [Methanosarcinaceae archaeon]
MELTQKYTTIVHKEDDWHVSWFPDLDIASQGKTVEEAL